MKVMVMFEIEKVQNIFCAETERRKERREALFEKKAAAASCFLCNPTHPPSLELARSNFRSFWLGLLGKPSAV